MNALSPAITPQALARDGAEGLRLALFSGNYNYTRDGANQALNRLVGWLESQGAAVRVYSPTTDTPAFPPQGQLVSVPSIGAPGRPDYRVALGLPRAIRLDIEAFAPTAVHLSAPDFLNQGARRLASRMGVPVVASLHTRFETYLAYYGLEWLRPPVEAYLHGFYAGCDRVLAPNRPIAALLESHGLAGRVDVWSRGVDRSQFSPARRDLDWRRAHGLADDDIAVAFLGRLVLEKGLDVFADTMAAMSARGLRVRPLIIGDGPARSWFQARLPGAVFCGALYGEALGRALASGDILFNPSRTEAFGNATLEAMASGLAVVCPHAPSTAELVTADVDGVLVHAPSPAHYAQAIAALASDPVGRSRLGATARRRSADFDWPTVCAAVLEVYGRLGAVKRRHAAYA